MTSSTPAGRIAKLFDANESRVADYIRQGEKIESYISRKLGDRNLWALSPEKRRLMFALVKLLRPEVAVETGVGPGSSTTTILAALGKGVLHSIDLGVKYGNEKEAYPVGFLVPERLRGKWKLHTGNSADILVPLLDELGTIQLFYHDSTHEEKHVMFELRNAWDHMESGIIAVDNCMWTPAPGKLSLEKGARLMQLSRKQGGFCIIPKNIG